MDIHSNYYNKPQFNSSDLCSGESSSASDGTSSVRRAIFSDEELMLASSHPKKRAGRKKFRVTRHPVYRGIRRRNSCKWVCEVRKPNNKSRIWLGTYPTADMAARAHDVAAIALRGRSACLNFADSTWRLPVPASTHVKDIQKAAAEAAEAFRPSQSDVVFGDDVLEESATSLQENLPYTDDEVFFGMPELLANMAEGLMLLPPHCCGEDGRGADDVEINAEMSLWTYSI